MSFASAEVSGAFAQAFEQGDETSGETIGQTSGHASGETPGANGVIAPVFISEEVVQPLPAEPGEGAAGPGDDADGPKARSLSELVSRTDTDFDLSEQMQCLAGAIYFESRGEPLDGQLAVAQVIINRTESSRFPQSYCGVVYQRSQFSFVRNGTMPRIRTGSDAWNRAKAIARIAHEGIWESQAGDALYFHAKYVRPDWSRRKIARATISRHIFYR